MTGKRNLNLVNKKVTGNWHQRSVYTAFRSDCKSLKVCAPVSEQIKAFLFLKFHIVVKLT